jgi:hypothetical protein
MIEESFNKLTPYLKGLKKTDNYRMMEVNLKSTWKIPKKEGIESKTKSLEGNSNLIYNLFYSESVSFDDMIDWLKSDVIDYNLEIEEKERLLKAKVEELKRVFETKNLDELNNLKFTTEEDVLRLSNKKEEVQPEYENNTEEN